MTERPDTPLLDLVETPADLRKLDKSQLRQFADELRAETISAVSVTGGHLGAGLGVVELTVAIHYVFNTPEDRLVWDVGHQCYPHKIITGRRDRIRSIRMGGGLSGFTKRSESEYDPFGAAHSSTSISAALGFAVANKLSKRPGKAIAVIGDGAMSAGMAYEAMNNAEQAGNRLIVILNDNDMSIAPPVGGLSNYLARLVSSQKYLSLRGLAKRIVRKISRRIYNAAEKAEEFARGMATGGTLFEELGFYYVGPVDGHDIDVLVKILENVRDAEEGPILIHAVTQKGKGYAPAEAAADKYHGVVKFDVDHRQAGQGAGRRPAGLPERVRRDAGEAGRRGSPDLRDHRGDAVRHRRRQVRAARIPTAPSTSASPSSMASPSPPASPRRGCGRSARSTRPSCSAPTIRSSMTWRSRICRCASRWTAPGWSAPMGRPMPAASISLTSAPCPISS